jgi:glycosyltransferase involved in cell wall biosynthesis
MTSKSSSTPLVSVIMSAYNNVPYINATIESILGQSCTDFEFLIANDGSVDDSGAVIDSYAAQDSRIRVFHQENMGYIPSLNKLRQQVRGSLIARTDADDLSHPDRFSIQLAWLAEHPDVGALGTSYDNIDEHGGALPPPPSLPLCHDEIVARMAAGPQTPDNNIYLHSSLFVRRECLDAVNGYHAAFRHCEDYDLWLRLAEVTKLANLPDRLLQYRCYPQQVSRKFPAELMTNALLANRAWLERLAGKPDPLADLIRMPPLEEIDRLFGPGTARDVRSKLAPTMFYDQNALLGKEFKTIIQYVEEGGRYEGLWRTVARLIKLGNPSRASQLALALLRN